MGIDPLSGGAMAAAALGAAATVGSHVYGAERAASSNERINEANERLQRELNARNEQLMREAWNRDDNAVLRRAIDLKQAGLSKTLAAGSAGAASSPIKLESPRLDQTDNAWAGAGAGIGKALGGVPMQAMQFASAEAQRQLTTSMIETEESKRKGFAAKAASDLANAGFKSEASRIVRKDADLWTKQGVDVRDRDAISKVVKQVPGLIDKIKGEVSKNSKIDLGLNAVNPAMFPLKE